MKNLLTIFIFVSTVVFSSTSFGEWAKLSENMSGDTFYIDFEGIRKVDGYVYFWVLADRLKPNKWGDFSTKEYFQGDCEKFRMLKLSTSIYKEPMGRGSGENYNSKDADWIYPTPDSVNEAILESVCSR